MSEHRFLRQDQVAAILNISASQTYALVRSGDLPAIKIGGRGQWRVETTALEDYIKRMYEGHVNRTDLRDNWLFLLEVGASEPSPR